MLHLRHQKRGPEVSVSMKGYSYIITRDFGFAPNPFHGVCTLATCKPIVRKHCEVGDYVIGLSPRDRGMGNKLIYLMKVTEVMTFDEYWNNPRFEVKKPVMNGSLKMCYGDNIYHHGADGNWMQEDSHHTNEDGSINTHNLNRDTKTTDRVLLSNDFYYFGKDCVTLPKELVGKITIGVGQKRLGDDVVREVCDYVHSVAPLNGYLGEPKKFKVFERYDGR